jgi:ATP-dependent DNA ligase
MGRTASPFREVEGIEHEDPEWPYELKLDGYRAIGFTSEGRARLWSRNGKDFVRPFSEVAKAIASLPEDTAIDGEFHADGKPSFALLQGSLAGAAPVGLACGANHCGEIEKGTARPISQPSGQLKSSL